MRGVQKWNNTKSSLANIRGPIHPQDNPIGVAPEVPIFVTRKDGRFGNDEIDVEESEIATLFHRRRIESASPSPVQAVTTTHEVIRSPQPPQPPIRYPTRPPALAPTSTNFQPPVASTSRDPMSPEPESVFYHLCCCHITGNFTYQKRMNKKVVT
ncbi:hypothetical protein O181_086322 [Austropuccinia psidii MF-1]|uniref:Uncharacterized protein n=1 Tax=Austropuccinia psidii MF-1 TaxID=1389203 RepID=A0A9Q3FXN7_9BASI|nr:hypothetical protein [Austropuccinia psidii MF-1]